VNEEPRVGPGAAIGQLAFGLFGLFFFGFRFFDLPLHLRCYDLRRFGEGELFVFDRFGLG